MTDKSFFSRRSFLSLLGTAPLAAALPQSLFSASRIPVGLELYSVRNALKQDLMGTVTDVAHLGYQCVEFYAPYFDWTPEYAVRVRKLLDTLGIRCYSTHNSLESFAPDGINKAIELDQALGTQYVVLSSAGDVTSLDGWKRTAGILNTANSTLASHRLHAGYHNHDLEWKPVDSQIPMEILAASTDKSIMLQLDVGTCIAAGSDPVHWIESHPGRIRSMHCKDWSPEKGYRVLFGEGVAPWKKLFAAAESVGGLEYYLIEQEGSDYPELETARRCLATFRTLHS